VKKLKKWSQKLKRLSIRMTARRELVKASAENAATSIFAGAGKMCEKVLNYDW
jgi:hypothetical protein